MRNEKAVANKLTEALKVLMKFKKYCEDFDIKISDFEAYVRGKNKPYKLNGHSIKDIAWSAHGYADRLMIRFKSSKLLNTRVNALGYYYNAYQIPLTKLTITTLKESVKEEDKHSIVSEVKQWASKNKVKFHKYSKGATKEYLCCVCLIGSDNNFGVAVGKWNNKFVTGKWDNSDDPFIRNEFDSIEEVINYLNKWINSNEIKNVKKEVTSMCKVFKHNTTGVSVIASTKEDALKVFAFNAERIDDTTKALYEMMNEGSFQYNYRTDNKNFMKFINTTLWDEIQDTIKSSKDLIKKCIEKRSSNSSIVWHALFMIFSFVKQASRLRANITSDKMKNWFAFNNTDYKTALKKIVDDYMNDFRSELRESESKVTASRKWDNTDEGCQNYKEDFDDLWLPKINELKKKLNKLKNIEFIVYYGDKTDSNLYFNKWAKWAYEEGYDIGSAPIKLMWWIKDLITKYNISQTVDAIENLINQESDDDNYWIFINSNADFDEWFDKVKKVSTYLNKHPELKLKYDSKTTAESMNTHKIIYDLQKFAGSSLIAYFKDDTMNSFMPLNKNLTVCKDFAQEYEDNSKLLVLFKQFLISYPTKATIQLRSTKTGKVIYEIDSVNRKWKKFINNVDKKTPKSIGREMTSAEKKLKEYATKFELEKDEIKDIIELASKNKDIKKLTDAIIELIMKNSGYKDKKELFKDCQCDEKAFIGFATFLSKNIEELRGKHNMREFNYKGKRITASTNEEAIQKVIEGSYEEITEDLVESIDYDDPNAINYYRSNAVKGIDFDKLLRVLVDAGIYFAEDLTKKYRYRAAYSLNSHKELQKAVLNNDLESVKKFVKEWGEANSWDGTFWPAMSKKKSSIAKDILSRYHKNTPFVEKVDKAKLMEKAMLRACHDAGVDDIGKLSDGYHTFDDLYYQRCVLFAKLVELFKDKAWKTKRHEDGEPCFGGTNFLVCIDTPEGPYSYHYPLKDWDMFKCKEIYKAKPFDGHTSKDVGRILSL